MNLVSCFFWIAFAEFVVSTIKFTKYFFVVQIILFYFLYNTRTRFKFNILRTMFIVRTLTCILVINEKGLDYGFPTPRELSEPLDYLISIVLLPYLLVFRTLPHIIAYYSVLVYNKYLIHIYKNYLINLFQYLLRICFVLSEHMSNLNAKLLIAFNRT